VVKDLNCAEYLREYVAAHADNELTSRSQRIIERHLRACIGCYASFVEQTVLKALVRQNVSLVRTPAVVKRRIKVALFPLE
jgi:hypothetical protein